MPLLLQEIPPAAAPVALLLLADPSEAKLAAYLPQSQCFIATDRGILVGAGVIQGHSRQHYELMSIAVPPEHQRTGYGSALLEGIISHCRRIGAQTLEVGTGTFGYQLAFYQRHGFRAERIDHDFFVKNYPAPIFEDGIRLYDMLRLRLDLTTPTA